MIRSDAIIRDLTRVNRPLQKHSAESLRRSTRDVPQPRICRFALIPDRFRGKNKKKSICEKKFILFLAKFKKRKEKNHLSSCVFLFLKRKQVRGGEECEKIDERIKWTDFEHCPPGSLNLKESRKLGEVMAPDDDDR